jgi:type VI secretion system protein ImpD
VQTNFQHATDANAQVSLDSLYTREAWVVSLADFLKEKNTRKALTYWLTEFVDTESLQTTDDIHHAIDRSIAEIDELINDQLNIIIHDPDYQKLEASWRGVWHLVAQAEGVRNIKIKILDITWAEIAKDIDRAIEFDQSQLFNKVYNEEYGIAGGEPYGVLIGDFEISHKPSARHPQDDIATLSGLAEIAAASFSPFIASASSELFGIENFSTLGSSLNLAQIFTQTEYVRWRALREKPDARFLGLTLPRILMRTPYRKNPGSYKGIYFYEKNMNPEQTMYLWGNASYAFGCVLIREFANVGWFGHIRGVPRNKLGGGLVTNLSTDFFETDKPDIATKPSSEILITDSLEREISELGLVPLCHCYGTPFSAFYSNQSIQKAIRKNSNVDNTNYKLSTMLQHVLCASRVAHYIKVMIRDKIGSFLSAEECQIFLQRWLLKYTTGRHDLEWEQQARYPLKEGNVSVKEHPSKPGQYICVIHLVPHYQVDQMVSELELVTELLQSPTK